MHKCLLISEVVTRVCLELVCSDLYPSHNQYPGTLAALAATCRAISEPALDALWHTHYSIVPLLRCMPSDLWEVREVQGTIYLYLRRPIVSTDWSRLQTYAHRITALGTYASGFPRKEFLHGVSAEAFRALSCSKPVPGALCPNIRSLDWRSLISNCDNETFQYIGLFLGPNTKHLNLSLAGADVTRLSIILSLPRSYPGLTEINFEHADEEDRWLNDISDTVRQWNLLESFSWDGELSYHALIHLANLTNLQKIGVFVPDLSVNDWHGHLLTLQRPAFRALRKATFNCSHLSSCTSLINLMPSSGSLNSLSVDACQVDEAHVAGSFMQALNVHCSHLALTTLLIDSYSNWPVPFTAQHIVDEDMLRPLLVFSNMKVMRMSIPCAFKLGNRIVEDIATSGPKLQSLTIGADSWAGQSQVTLAGLIPLLSLPKLEQLRIVINASSVDYTLDMPPAGVSNTKISTLDLADSVILDVHPVAAFLSDVLPNLTNIYSWRGQAAAHASVSPADAKKYKSRWKTVVSLIDIIAKVRKQERSSMSDVLTRMGQHASIGVSTADLE